MNMNKDLSLLNKTLYEKVVNDFQCENDKDTIIKIFVENCDNGYVVKLNIASTNNEKINFIINGLLYTHSYQQIKTSIQKFNIEFVSINGDIQSEFIDIDSTNEKLVNAIKDSLRIYMKKRLFFYLLDFFSPHIVGW